MQFLKNKTNLSFVVLILLGLLSGGLVMDKFLKLNFDILLGIICFPFVITFQQSEKKLEYKYIIWGSLFLILYGWLGILSFAFFSLGCYFLVILNNFIGKTNHSAWILWIVISPFFNFMAKVFSFPIRLQLSTWAAKILNLTSWEVVNNGNIILVDGKQFSVDPECMGLNMLSLCLVLALVVLVYFQKLKNYQLKFYQLIIFLSIAVILSMFSNFVRIVLLVLFDSPPNTIGHEIIGLMCLLVYAIFPFGFLVYLYFKKKTGKVVYNTKIQQLTKLKGIVITVFCGLILLVHSIAPPSSHVKQDVAFDSIFIEGMDKEIVENNILKLSNSKCLIYIKPSVNFFGAHHSPLICWQGSGYKIPVKTEHQIGEFSYATGTMINGSDSLYTAWWFDNGTDKTISQLDWRKNMLFGSDAYRLINVTANNKADLDEEIKRLINLNLFSLKTTSNH
jgi:exosortase N